MDTSRLSPTKKLPESLGARMHRKLYPSLYTKVDEVNWKPKRNVQTPKPYENKKKIDPKWARYMRMEGVQKNLSTSLILKPTTPIPSPYTQPHSQTPYNL